MDRLGLQIRTMLCGIRLAKCLRVGLIGTVNDPMHNFRTPSESRTEWMRACCAAQESWTYEHLSCKAVSFIAAQSDVRGVRWLTKSSDFVKLDPKVTGLEGCGAGSVAVHTRLEDGPACGRPRSRDVGGALQKARHEARRNLPTGHALS